MAIKTRVGWECSYCGKSFNNKVRADLCMDSHDLVYVPMTRSDIARLVQFIMTKEERILTKTIFLTLQAIVKKERIKLGNVRLAPPTSPEETIVKSEELY